MAKKVIIASQNPVKVEATRLAFEGIFPDDSFMYKGIHVESGVRDQPMSSDETLKGAQQRAENARNKVKDAFYWVGIEGGIEEKDKEMEAFAWVVILSAKQTGRSRTSSFYLPPKVVSLIRQGMELGEADDIVFGKSNSKQKNGAVGLLTGNILTRTTYYREALILALIPFKNPELY